MSATKPAIKPADRVTRTANPLDTVYTRVSKCTTKSQLKISMGDPTYDGNLVAPVEATEALASLTHIPTLCGYQRTWGWPAACDAVAAYMGRQFAGPNAAACKGENVVLACGASEALTMVFTALCDEGDNMLMPAPGFPQYGFVADVYDFEHRYYHMTVENNWEVDLNEVRGLIDDRTKAILITNPSNPTGSSWRREHVEELVKLAEEYKLPIVADEIYAGMVYEGVSFTSFSEFDTPVPRFMIGGTAKNFMAPGWRCGWCMLIDRDGYATGVLRGIQNLSMMSLGPNATVQHALPDILSKTPQSYFDANMKEIESNARFFASSLERCHGLSCASPQGALYIMVKVHCDQFEDFKDDVDFYKALEDEENIQVVPGTYMLAPGYFRVVITRPQKIIQEVMERLPAFCERHRKK